MQEEDKNLSAEELGKKLDKYLKQSEEQLQKLNCSSKELRAHIFGQDRYWRRYWELPCAGGIYVEAMESAEPEVLPLQDELDEKYKNMPVEEKAERTEEVKEDKTGTENRENETPNELKEEKKVNAHKEDEDVKSNDERKKGQDNSEQTVNNKKEMNNCIDEDLKNSVSDVKSEADTSTDAKTNAASDKVKQEDEVIKMDIDIKTEESKKEDNSTDEEIVKHTIKMEDKIIETMANGDKFNHVNSLHNGKDLNGSYLSGKIFLNLSYWFNIMNSGQNKNE